MGSVLRCLCVFLEFAGRLGLQPDGWRVFFVSIQPLNGGEHVSQTDYTGSTPRGGESADRGSSPRWRGTAYSAVNSKQTFLSCLFGSDTTICHRRRLWCWLLEVVPVAIGGSGYASDVFSFFLLFAFVNRCNIRNCLNSSYARFFCLSMFFCVRCCIYSPYLMPGIDAVIARVRAWLLQSSSYWTKPPGLLLTRGKPL